MSSLQSDGSQKVAHKWVTKHKSTQLKIPSQVRLQAVCVWEPVLIEVKTLEDGLADKHSWTQLSRGPTEIRKKRGLILFDDYISKEWLPSPWKSPYVWFAMQSCFSPVWLFAALWNVAPLSMGLLQARILDWVAISFSRGSSWPSDRTHVSHVSCIGRRIRYHFCHLGSSWERVPGCCKRHIHISKASGMELQLQVF